MRRARLVERLRVFYTMTIGMNSYKNQERKSNHTIHAEFDAINKLPNRKNKSIKKINLLVIRTTKTGKLSSSKPCYSCIMDMLTLPPKKGYKIEWIYHSNEDETISKVKLATLYKSGDFHYSSFHSWKNK